MSGIRVMACIGLANLLIAVSVAPGMCQDEEILLPSVPEASFIAIIVSDLDSSLTWYSDVLGFEIMNQTRPKDSGFMQANLQSAGISLELIQLSNSIHSQEILEKEGPGARIIGFYKFGMKISAFDEWIEFLEQSGVEFHGRVVRNPLTKKNMVIIKDPDGNRIQLFEK